MYCIITNVVRKRITGFDVIFELRDDQDNVIPNGDSNSRSIGLEFPTEGTRQERIDIIRTTLESHFQSVINIAKSVKDAIAAVSNLLIGIR